MVQRFLFLIFILSLGFTLQAVPVSAAPCCAGSNAVPALIAGDESQNLQIGVSSATVIGDAPGAGLGIPVFRDALSPKEEKEILTVNYARLIDRDRWQSGISLPLQRNRLAQNGKDERAVALGDISLTLAYETLPEWEYTLMIPRVFSFLQLTLPTGKSIYESGKTLFSDASGLDQFQLALGALAIKRWSTWDANSVIKMGWVLGRSFQSPQTGKSVLSSTWTAAGSAGVGYSFWERYRAGTSVSFEYQSPLSIQNAGIESIGSQRLVWSAGLSLTYLSGADDSFILGYQDQTLLGPALNSSLSRAFSLAYSHRVER
jgi:hypothetical protein